MGNLDYIMFNLTKFIVIFLIIIIVFFLFLKYLIRKSSVEGNKIKLLGIFLGLNNIDIFSLSILILRYVFIIYMLFNFTVNSIYLTFLLVISFVYCFLNKRFFYFFIDILNSVLYYYGIMIFGLLISYLNDVLFVWYVLIITILLGLFILLYSSYFFLLNTTNVLEHNNYIKKIGKKKNEK